MKMTLFVIVRRAQFMKLFYIITALILCGLFFLLMLSTYGTSKSVSLHSGDASTIEQAKLAIIIDDFGSGRDGVKEMMEIDRHITFAVLPFLDYSLNDAEKAYEKGYEVIVHLAMEPMKGKRSWLGPNPILAGMSYDEVRTIVKDSMESISFAKGANIHMGSKASSDETIVSAILDEIKDRKLYFVDSLTSSKPVAKKLAEEKNIICFNRDVFLDGQQPKEFIIKRLKQAQNVALKKGYAVAIGHVGIEGGKVTAQAICEMLPEFDKNNVKLVFISEL